MKFNLKLTNIKQRTDDWYFYKSKTISPTSFNLLYGSSYIKNKLLTKIRKNLHIEFYDELEIKHIISDSLLHGIENEKHAIKDTLTLLSKVLDFDDKFILDNSQDLFFYSEEYPVSCSPDFYSRELRLGIEIKCPFTKEVHLEHFKGNISDIYKFQVYGYMLLLDLPEYYFISYNKKVTPNIAMIKFTRDDKKFYKLENKLKEFCFNLKENILYGN